MHFKQIQKVVVDRFRAFCKQSSLHGFYYFCETRHWSVYLIWTCIIISSLGLCASLCQMIWQKFVVDPTFTVVESTHHSTTNVPFPAVSVCDNEKVYGPHTYNITNILVHRNFNYSQIEDFYNSFVEVEKDTYSAPEHVKKMHKILADLGYSYNELIEILVKPCEVLLVECQWRSQIHNCTDMFRMVHTVAGYCCQFDMKYFKKHTDPRTNFESGKERTEALGIVVNGQKTSYNGTLSDGYVLMFVINYKNSLTVVNSPTTLTPGGVFDVNVFVWVIDSSKDVETLPLNSRKCLLETDDVDTGRFYQECMSILILRRVVAYCRCLPFRYTYQMLNVEDYPVCTWERMSCIYQTIAKVKSNIRDIVSQYECLQNCDDVQYETEIEYFKNLRKLKHQNESYSRLVVHFSSNTCLKYRREVLYAWDQMVANLGGIFGLCLGGSIISLIEIIWFIFDLLINIFKSLKVKKPNKFKTQVFALSSKELSQVKQSYRKNKLFEKYPYLD